MFAVLSDFWMPQGTGFDLAALAAKETPAPYFFLMTAFPVTLTAAMVAVGIREIFSEPLDFDAIIARIRGLPDVP